MKKNIRTHDELYLKENRYENAKESFLYLANKLKKDISKNKIYTLLDVGCANGELLYLLKKKFKNIKFTGADVREDLLLKAKKKLGNEIRFIKKNIFQTFIKKKYDFVICSGVIGITDNPKKFLSNLIKMKSKNGIIYLFHHFNEFDYNVYIKYQNPNNKHVLESGWNIFSLKFIKAICKNYKVKLFKFNMKKKLYPQKRDLVRTWTIRINNKNHFTNGLSLLLKQYWIKIY